MFSIPETFSNEEEGYITLPALKRFAKAKKDEEFRTTCDRKSFISDIENYANKSKENEEEVLDWLDSVLVEGIKDVQIKSIDPDSISEILYDDSYLEKTLSSLLFPDSPRHLLNKYSECIRLFKYEIRNDSHYGRIIRLYLGKLVCTINKQKQPKNYSLYPIFIEIYLDKMLIVSRAKSKAGLYEYKENFIIETAETTTAEKQIEIALKYVCDSLKIKTLLGTTFFKNNLYNMLEKYTNTPSEITEKINAKSADIKNIVDIIMNKICVLSPKYREDVNASILNMVEKYFSISANDKNIFTKDREAYPLKLNATDEEESRVEQTAAKEEPLQSKAIFFDNKKMLQKSKACDGITFNFKRLDPMYCKKDFKVKIQIKRDCCLLKFTEYTSEEDIINVLFSLIGTSEIPE